MKYKSGMPQLFGLVLQVLGVILFIITPYRVLPAGLIILGAVIVLADYALSSTYRFSAQYSATITMFSLILLLFYVIFGFRLATNALMLAGLATAFVLEIISTETKPGGYSGSRLNRKQIKEDAMIAPEVETYFDDTNERPNAGIKFGEGTIDDYTDITLDDEKKRIIEELSNIREEIVSIADDNIESPKALKLLFGKKDGKSYHTIDCLSLKNTNRKDLRVFNSVSEARKGGYKPCRICKP